jgi:hypothetical protein
MQHSRIILTTDEYVVKAVARSGDERSSKSRAYVSRVLAVLHDVRLRELEEQEASLGDRRFSERGEFPDVDKLYDRLNRRVATVYREIALDALRRLECGDFTGNFSRYAGCSCPCSPGVVLSRGYYSRIGDRMCQVDLFISPVDDPAVDTQLTLF